MRTDVAGQLPNECEISHMHLYMSADQVQLLLFWSLSNAVLASVILSGGGSSEAFSDGGNGNRTAVYMLVILSEFTNILRTPVS